MRTSLLKLALESEEEINVAEALALAQDIQSDEEETDIVTDEKIEEVADAVEAGAALEELLAAVEPAEGEVIEAGPVVEKVLAVAVEQIFERWGQPSPTFMALEAEGGVDVAGKVAQIKEFLIKLWKRIVEAFSSIYESVSDFLATAFSAATRVEKAAIGLLRESRSLHGTPRHSTYSNRDMAKRLSGDDSIGIVKLFDRTLDLTEMTVQIAYNEPAKLVTDLIKGWAKHYETTRTVRPGIEVTTFSDDRTAQLAEQLPKVLHDAYTARFMRHDKAGVNVNDAPDNVGVYTTPILLGGYVGVVQIPLTVEDLQEFSFRIYPVTDDVGDNEIQSDVPVSDVRQQEELLKMVIQNCGQIRRFSKNLPALKQLDVELKNTLKLLKVGAGTEQERAIEKDIIRTIARVAPRIAQGIHHKALAFALNSSRTILKHVQYSIHAYEGNQVK